MKDYRCIHCQYMSIFPVPIKGKDLFCTRTKGIYVRDKKICKKFKKSFIVQERENMEEFDYE